jgi:hypothetical protein
LICFNTSLFKHLNISICFSMSISCFSIKLCLSSTSFCKAWHPAYASFNSSFSRADSFRSWIISSLYHMDTFLISSISFPVSYFCYFYCWCFRLNVARSNSIWSLYCWSCRHWVRISFTHLLYFTRLIPIERKNKVNRKHNIHVKSNHIIFINISLPSICRNKIIWRNSGNYTMIFKNGCNFTMK